MGLCEPLLVADEKDAVRLGFWLIDSLRGTVTYGFCFVDI